MIEQPVPIELTSKRHKRMMIMGVLLCSVGTVLLIGNMGWGAVAGIGLLVLIAGIVTFLSARFGAWWDRG